MTYVNAGDIARLADVGRAAVSNWRRRHDDFPQPVGGTANSPLFSLAEVEEWLRRNGKPFSLSAADLAWQRLRASGDDLRLGELVAAAGDFLEGRPAALPADVTALVAELAEERGRLDAFEFLCERYAEAHSRQLAITPPDLADLMVRLSGGGVLLDPACGLGTLLLTAKAARGQDASGSAARIAATRLRMRGVAATVHTGDSLRANGLPGGADAVVCDPPFNERTWGYEELTADPRWEFGLPPRGEPELAWVQHCLSRVRAGGTVTVLMPPAAAARRPGRRIRSNLLRAGVLRAVIAAGASDIWLLRRPEPGERTPSRVLLFDAAGDLNTVEPAWRDFLATGRGGTSVIDLLDDEVDVSPLRFGNAAGPPDYAGSRARFAAAVGDLTGALPSLSPVDPPREPPMTTIAELARGGSVAIHHSSARVGSGDQPVLTADDLTGGGPPTGWAEPGSGLVMIEPGDVVATPTGTVRVVQEIGWALGPQLTLYRVDPARLDADFLAGFLRAGSSLSRGASRLDARRTKVPRLPLAQQREYGAAFRRLADLDTALHETSKRGQELIRLALDGLAAGHLQ